MSDSVRPHRRQPIRLPCPWDSPGKNTGVGCHFLLQCMKVKSESEVTQSSLTLPDPMDWSLPGSSVLGIFQERVLEWGAIAFSYIFSIENHIKLIVQYFKINTKSNFWLIECVNSLLQCVCVCVCVCVFNVRMNVRSNEFTKVFAIFYII